MAGNKFNICVCLFLLITPSYNSQSTEIDTFTGEVKINNQLTFGDTQQATKNAFGQPDNITTEYWEMDEETATNYHYNDGAKLQFTNNNLESFVITSSNYYLKMGSFQLRLANNINSIQNRFPKSYSFRKSRGTSIALGTGDYRFILVEYNSNNIITRIDIRFF